MSDRYRIERELGQGGMATVYLAETKTAPQLVLVLNWFEEPKAKVGGTR